MAKNRPSYGPYLWSSLIVLFVLAVVAVLSASAWVSSYLQSERFRSLVAAKTGEVLHSTVTCSGLHWTGASAYMDSMEAQGTPGSQIDSIAASQIRADVNWRTILQGAWRVEQIDIVRLDGTFRPVAPADATPPPPQAPVPPATGLKALLPTRFELGILKVAEAGFQFQNAAGSSIATVKKCSLSLQPDGPGWSASGNDGTLSMPGFPELAITDFRLRQQNGKVFLSDSNFRLGANGKISASGEFGDGANVRLEWQQVDAAPFLSADWKNHLSGVLSGNANVQLPSGNSPAFTATGQFNLTDGLLQNLPVLEQVATFTGAPEFRRMPLQQLSGDFVYGAGTVTITNFVMESKGLMRIEGSLRVANGGGVDGAFRVGVTPQTLQWLPGSRERVFTTAENGYLWTNVRVGGTLQNPQEDLSARLVLAMGNQVIDQGIKTLENAPKTLENAPGSAVQGAQGVLNALSPLLK